MLRDFLISFVNTNFLYSIFICFFFGLTIIRAHNFFCRSFREASKYKNNIQTIHEGQISRLGGITIVFSFLYYGIFNENEEVKKIIGFLLLSSIPIIVSGLIEDLFQNVSHNLRLFFIFLSSITFTFFSPFKWPFIDLFFLNELINSPVGAILFYSFAISSISNAINIIDGMNGLAAFAMLASFFALAFLSYVAGDYLILNISAGMFAILLGFLLLNFPLGKIFMGDMGAYFSGFILSSIIIIFYGRHYEFNYWGAFLLLIYPAIEILFSIVRKLLMGRSPFFPDGEHLHLMVFFLLKKILKSAIKANILTTVFLSIIWVLPLTSLLLDYRNEQHIIYVIFFSVFLYIFTYIVIKYFLNKINYALKKK